VEAKRLARGLPLACLARRHKINETLSPPSFRFPESRCSGNVILAPLCGYLVRQIAHLLLRLPEGSGLRVREPDRTAIVSLA